MATNYSDLVDLARSEIGFPDPATGGTDKLSDANLIKYLNRGFALLARSILGVPRYVEFTVATDGTITVTKPSTAYQQPTVQKRSPELWSYDLFHVDDLYSLIKLENLTDPTYKTDERIIPIRSIHDPARQADFNSTGQDHYSSAVKLGDRGFYLGPSAITQTNTIGATYNGKFREYNISSVSQTTGSGLSDITISGIFTNTKSHDDIVYKITILTAATPDTYKIEKSVDGGTTFTTLVASANCSTSAVTVEKGLTITWGATTGHVATDVFQFTARSPSLVDLMNIDIFDEHECEAFPVSYTVERVLRSLDDMRSDKYFLIAFGPNWIRDNEPGGELLEFIEGRSARSQVFDYSLVDPLDMGRGYS